MIWRNLHPANSLTLIKALPRRLGGTVDALSGAVASPTGGPGPQKRDHATYLPAMCQHIFQPCIPTGATTVPAAPDWLHEIKHDGFRLVVRRARSILKQKLME
ncbi:hypothetical protein [Bradyrhizobium sp. Ash2021]|uniref:hypothetical protein n=1 Tax=Bradyrhizobium sp. Ash2021 TaxID=2954771 RepID=UPI0028157674|nr:hypothetical protein [Bradyrhizobium sp. Ash2021]WMT71051.1 hypothetical protein NL528_23360 [Bradyrhizobium sp. Ash2021]